MNMIHKNTACKRLRGLGLEQQSALELLDTIGKWRKANGSDWTISRLKSLKVAYINKLAGQKDIFKDLPWIAHHADSPKGPFKKVFRMKKVQKAISVLMVYTSEVYDKLTENQWNKFHRGVTSKLTEEQNSNVKDIGNKLYQYVVRNWNGKKGTRFTEKYDNYEQWVSESVNSPVVKYKTITKFNLKSSPRTIENFVDSLAHPLVQDFLIGRNNILAPEDDESKRNLLTVQSMAAQIGEDDNDNLERIAGKIGFIQEPGGKLRSVANPFVGIQYCLAPLGTYCYKLLRKIEEDCTFNQEKAVTDIQSFWKGHPGKEMMSIDLSSATDLFPLDLQIKVLEGLSVSSKHIKLLKEVSRMDWILPEPVQKQFKEDKVSWSQGQPMGTYPSFGLFALTHHVLARQTDPLFYRILGDDIIIDAEAGEKLIKLYQSIGCKISMEKTIRSNVLCEFGGKLISPNKYYIQPKWKMPSDRSFIDLARRLGPQSLSLFNTKQREVLKILDPLIPSLTPYGLGWNTKQYKYSFRKELTETFIQGVQEKFEMYSAKVRLEVSDLTNQLKASPYLYGKRILPKDSMSKIVTQLSYEERILEHCNIHMVKSNDLLKPDGFNLENGLRLTGDPRGLSTLEIVVESSGYHNAKEMLISKEAEDNVVESISEDMDVDLNF